MSKLGRDLNEFFLDQGFKWNRDDKTKFVPTVEDFDQALDKVTEALYAEPDGTQMEFGRLIVKKDAGNIDVYVNIGTLGDNR